MAYENGMLTQIKIGSIVCLESVLNLTHWNICICMGFSSFSQYKEIWIYCSVSARKCNFDLSCNKKMYFPWISSPYCALSWVQLWFPRCSVQSVKWPVLHMFGRTLPPLTHSALVQNPMLTLAVFLFFYFFIFYLNTITYTFIYL